MQQSSSVTVASEKKIDENVAQPVVDTPKENPQNIPNEAVVTEPVPNVTQNATSDNINVVSPVEIPSEPVPTNVVNTVDIPSEPVVTNTNTE